MNRNPDRTGLIGDGAHHALSDPPRRIGAELVPALIFEFVNGLHQADIPFLDEIQKLKTSPHVMLGHTCHQSQIGLNQPGLSVFDGSLGPFDSFDVFQEHGNGHEQDIALDMLHTIPDCINRIP